MDTLCGRGFVIQPGNDERDRALATWKLYWHQPTDAKPTDTQDRHGVFEWTNGGSCGHRFFAK